MAVNNVALDDVTELSQRLKDKIDLVQALANFHIEEGDAASRAVLSNQRSQIRRQLNEIDRDLSRLAALLALQDLEGRARTGPEPAELTQTELVTRFIEATVPARMRAAWEPDSFTGSLLMFFENGEIESSSLVEKKMRPSTPDDLQDAREKNTAKTRPVKVVQQPQEFFAIIKSLISSKINIYFYLSSPANVVIKIYDQKDRLVRYLEKAYDEPGDYSVEWDGCDDDGEPLPKDVYYCQLQIGGRLMELKTIEMT